jgi:hypothetical protein
MKERVMVDSNGRKYITTEPELKNNFNPDWDVMAVMVEEQQRMAKRIEELTQLVISQGIRLMDAEERAECDGGQCGIGGYCKECPKPLVKIKEMLEVQGRDGTWNYDPYFHGMYNGMEVMLAVLENRELVLRGAPEKWLSKKEWVGLTDEQYEAMAEQYVTNYYFDTLKYANAIEAKLKEKNAA